MNIPDSLFYDRAWHQARQSSSLYRHEQDPAAWRVFWDLFAPTYLKICRAQMPANRRLVNKWKKEGIVDRASRVLDIGCGPGTYTLPLGEAAGEVVAMDIAENMLDVLAEEAQRQKLTNIRLLQADWEEVEIEGEYDLVFAANSPPIRCLKTLLKMNRATRERGRCLYICYAGKVGPTLRHLLWENVMGEKMQGSTFDISYPFNILYREGYHPHVSFEEQSYTFMENAEKVLENYRAYFQIFGKKGAFVDNILEKHVREYSREGLITEKVSYKLAVMWW